MNQIRAYWLATLSDNTEVSELSPFSSDENSSSWKKLEQHQIDNQVTIKALQVVIERGVERQTVSLPCADHSDPKRFWPTLMPQRFNYFRRMVAAVGESPSFQSIEIHAVYHEFVLVVMANEKTTDIYTAIVSHDKYLQQT